MSPLAHEIMLTLAGGSAVSGRLLAQQFGCTRAAIWKQIQTLRNAGVVITASNSGYLWQQPGALLDAGNVFVGLQPAVAERLQHLQCVPVCRSTNALLLAQNHAGNACCLSEYQRGGRGRRGRQWNAPAYGSLLMSLRWEFACGANALALLGIRSGLLLRDILQQSINAHLQLKWPNDIVVQQDDETAKLAGILIEMQGSIDGPCSVIIGIGINVNWPADYLQQLRRQLCHSEVPVQHQALPPVDLATLGAASARNRLAATLINQLVSMCMQQEQGLGAPADELMAIWQQHDLLYGERIRVSDERSDDVIIADGTAAGIDAGGAYRVRADGRMHSFNASSISLRPWQAQSA